jgi:hypothetical protein
MGVDVRLSLKDRDMVAKALNLPKPSVHIIAQAAKLWRAGCDTQKIASLLHVDEADIWNRLTEIRRAP